MEVRRLALGLRPSLLDDLGLAPALERLVQDVTAHHPIALSLDVAGMVGRRLPEFDVRAGETANTVWANKEFYRAGAYYGGVRSAA